MYSKLTFNNIETETKIKLLNLLNSKCNYFIINTF